MKGQTSNELYPNMKGFGYWVPSPNFSLASLYTEALCADLNTRL